MASLRFRLRQHYWKWTAPSQIRNYLNASKTRKLQLGCGSNLLTGWLNTTLYPFDKGSVFMDVTLPFPMPDSSFDYIFSEHMIEHLEFEQAAWMLSESFRILKSGGRIRIATPDLAQIIALYTNPNGAAQQPYIQWIMDAFRPQIKEYNPTHVINHSFHGWRHAFIYDQATLKKAIETAGFIQVTCVQPGQSGDKHLHDIEQHGEYVKNHQAMLYETMVFEAVKP